MCVMSKLSFATFQRTGIDESNTPHPQPAHALLFSLPFKYSPSILAICLLNNSMSIPSRFSQHLPHPSLQSLLPPPHLSVSTSHGAGYHDHGVELSPRRRPGGRAFDVDAPAAFMSLFDEPRVCVRGRKEGRTQTCRLSTFATDGPEQENGMYPGERARAMDHSSSRSHRKGRRHHQRCAEHCITCSNDFSREEASIRHFYARYREVTGQEYVPHIPAGTGTGAVEAAVRALTDDAALSGGTILEPVGGGGEKGQPASGREGVDEMDEYATYLKELEQEGYQYLLPSSCGGSEKQSPTEHEQGKDKKRPTLEKGDSMFEYMNHLQDMEDEGAKQLAARLPPSILPGRGTEMRRRVNMSQIRGRRSLSMDEDI
ncbi:hypothetical protein G7K_1524-t1 [Saitoella complicata NRRL Y-17804]|uniref:Uncharacterized protein n=1 Tax=Saitoella complicata (strain BCRC 22490 / CBS 7301 / JCM 7358 / NBRC 10748 / NRRL Y-17804) TaxID=698492 RepID=A0A0E9NC62_SAICN|nr:hypothetical protein G7K_1524-t1 [Saitoella complicata NRRL Y-17804]